VKRGDQVWPRTTEPPFTEQPGGIEGLKDITEDDIWDPELDHDHLPQSIAELKERNRKMRVKGHGPIQDPRCHPLKYLLTPLYPLAVL